MRERLDRMQCFGQQGVGIRRVAIVEQVERLPGTFRETAPVLQLGPFVHEFVELSRAELERIEFAGLVRAARSASEDTSESSLSDSAFHSSYALSVVTAESTSPP